MRRDLFQHRLLTQMAKNIGSSALLLCSEFQFNAESRNIDIESFDEFWNIPLLETHAKVMLFVSRIGHTNKLITAQAVEIFSISFIF